MRDALLYCARCGTVHALEAIAAGDIRPESPTCRATELEALIDAATDMIAMGASSGMWGIAEEALDVVLSLNDTP